MKGFPGLSEEYLDAANDLFEHYLFFETEGKNRRIWTSCCHKKGMKIGELKRVETPEDASLMHVKHGEKMLCPFCGREVTVKNTKIARDCKKLVQYVPVVFLHTSKDGETVYAQAYWARKNFGGYGEYPEYMMTRVYRFRRGEVKQYERTWGFYNGKESVKERKDKPFTDSPFQLDSGNRGYKLIGLECLRQSFLRYTQYEKWTEGCVPDKNIYNGFVEYLGLAAKYPKGVEMLMKAGVEQTIKEYVWKIRKNSAVIKWGEKNPQRAFGLTKEELKEFLAGKKKLETLYVLKECKRKGLRIGVAEAEQAAEDLEYDRKCPRDAVRVAAGAGVKPGKLCLYLRGYMGGGCHNGGYRTLYSMVGYWWDYIEAAAEMDYDMTVPGVVMPRNLVEAHDNATALVNRRREEERARREAERDREKREELRLQKMKFEKRVEQLRKKYNYESGKYLIRVAESAEEIIAEGKALSHCVAGYADRHLNGSCTILFLRNREKPEKPFMTIEMNGKCMRQIHGYKNENQPSPENPKMINPQKLCASILNPWLEWVKAGSPRDKNGQPKLPKKIKKEAHVA